LHDTAEKLKIASRLDLSNIKINSFPLKMGSTLENIIEINLDNCGLKRAVGGLFNFKRLETLSLNNNQLSTLPVTFSELKHLTTISLRNNNFKQIPRCIFEIENLQNLDLSGNPSLIIPPEIYELENLTLISDQVLKKKHRNVLRIDHEIPF